MNGQDTEREDLGGPSLLAHQTGQVVTLAMRSPFQLPTQVAHTDLHWELGEAFSRLRGDDTVRVIVVCGVEDGAFLRQRPSRSYDDPDRRSAVTDPARLWRVATGITRFHETISAIEKPVIAKVNGDAYGFGQSVMFACDLIVARQDAVVCDNHLDSDPDGLGAPYGLVPGDGGAALVPAYLSPAKAKEYLMLGRAYTGAELAELGVINYAVPAEELDRVISELVARLLARAAYPLAWTKRLVNREIARRLHGTLDAAVAYELLSFHQAERAGWRDGHEL